MDNARKHICFNLGRVMRRVQEYYKQRLEPYGLTPAQFFVFNALWSRDGMNLSELADEVSLDNSTLTGIIDRMEKGGFVVRRQDPDNRRATGVFLTPKAREVGPEIMKLADELDAILRRPFSREQMDSFETVLRELAEVKGK
ncbi:MAG: MarR family transcriptional regulator [Chloroflexota bacterium]